MPDLPLTDVEATAYRTLAIERGTKVYPTHGVADAARPLMRELFQKAWLAGDAITDETSAKAQATADAKVLAEDFASLCQRIVTATGRVVARTWEWTKPAQPKTARGRVLAFFDGVLRALKPKVVMDVEKPEFDAVKSESVAWAREHATDFIQSMLDERRAIIETIIADGIEKGRSVDKTAKLLRDSVGLNARQGEALLALQDRLEEEGLDAEAIDDEVSARAEEMTESRAEMIAQTETMRASNEGQKEMWSQAVESGWLTGEELKEWIYTPDGNACQDCEDLDGQTVTLSDEFEEGDPPLHPYCRCTLGLSAPLA